MRDITWTNQRFKNIRLSLRKGIGFKEEITDSERGREDTV